MSEFEIKLLNFVDLFKKIQDEENLLQTKVVTTTADFQSFLRENGLPEKFTMAEALHLAVRKCRA